MVAKSKSGARTAKPKTQTFPSGNKGIVAAVKTAKQRGEQSITFQLTKRKGTGA